MSDMLERWTVSEDAAGPPGAIVRCDLIAKFFNGGFMMHRKDSDKMDLGEKHGISPWVLAIGTALSGFSLGLNVREQSEPEVTIDPPPLAKALKSPENFAHGIALIHVGEDEIRDPQRVVSEFEQMYPNLDIVAYEPQMKKIINSGTIYQLKLKYRLTSKE